MNEKIYAVCGRPVLHSKSPEIYKALFNLTNFKGLYTRICADNLEEVLTIADDLNLSGLNITAPFKADMFRLSDESDELSNYIETVNTVVFKNGRKHGYNTDIQGVVETIKQNGIDLNHKNCLIVGYGNAAKAAAFGIKKEWESSEIYNTGKRKEKIELFAEKFNLKSLYKTENIKPYLIISTIPKNEYFEISGYIKPCHYFMDASYLDSQMTKEALKHECKIITGEEWLVNQAIASFKIFTGQELPENGINDIKKVSIFNSQYEKKTNIYLTGFSGSGKTSIGKILAEKLGYLYFDTDKLIEESENLSINTIFQKKGVEYFRAVENEVLERISKIKNAVISCGGGTLLNDSTVNTANEKGYIIWLHTGLKNCMDRINRFDKPMLNSKSEKEIEELYNVRKLLYCKSADLIISNSGERTKTVENIVFELKMLK